MYNYMQCLAKSYPSFIELIEIGQSYEGRPLVVLKVKVTLHFMTCIYLRSNDDKNEIFKFNFSGLATREWASAKGSLDGRQHSCQVINALLNVIGKRFHFSFK